MFQESGQPSSFPQQTLSASFTCNGVGLHTGHPVTVQVAPSPVGSGYTFIRTDLPDFPRISVGVNQVAQTLLSTRLASGNVTIQTVEHLLAALIGMGIDNASIEVNSDELPLLDGSAQEWVRGITEVGSQIQNGTRPLVWLEESISLQQGDAIVAAFPADETRFTYGIDFDSQVIGNQWYSWSPGQQLGDNPVGFAQEIAPARTFGLAEQIDGLCAKGLIKGGTLDNALVCNYTNWINPPLRFTNEPVRHKLLDLIGDLSLLGIPPIAHYFAYKANHGLHVQFAKLLSDNSHRQPLRAV